MNKVSTLAVVIAMLVASTSTGAWWDNHWEDSFFGDGYPYWVLYTLPHVPIYAVPALMEEQKAAIVEQQKIFVEQQQKAFGRAVAAIKEMEARRSAMPSKSVLSTERARRMAESKARRDERRKRLEERHSLP